MDEMADPGDAREDAPESANDDDVVRLCGEGDGCAQQGQYDRAVLLYTQALDLLSVPLERHEAGAYILTAIGNAQFLTGDFDSAYQTLQHALRCPDGSTGPFIHLRLGQVLQEHAPAYQDDSLAEPEEGVLAALRTAAPALLEVVLQLATTGLETDARPIAARCPGCQRRRPRAGSRHWRCRARASR